MESIKCQCLMNLNLILSRKLRYSQYTKGFSLIEMVVGIGIASVIVGVFAVTLAGSLKAVSNIKNRKEISLKGQVAVSQFLREFKMLGIGSSILKATISELEFTNRWEKTLDYTLSAGSFYRKENGGPNSVLCDSVVTATSYFAYWDSNRVALTSFPLSQSDRDNVWRVLLTLDLGYHGQTIRYVENIFPENRKFSITE